MKKKKLAPKILFFVGIVLFLMVSGSGLVATNSFAQLMGLLSLVFIIIGVAKLRRE